MMQVTVTKDYSADLERNIFVLSGGKDQSTIELELKNAIKSAREKICAVFESGLKDDIVIAFAGSAARRYIIVPEIDEAKLSSISGRAIVREVPDIKGNYIIIDDSQLFLFDSNYTGVCISASNAVSVVFQIFLKDFWENAKFEYIDKRLPAAEATFDIPPVYGNDKVLLDESVEAQTAVEKLIDGMPFVGIVDKISEQNQSKYIIMKSPSANKNFLKTTTNEDILFVPGLPFSIVADKEKCFAFNFDIGKYSILPERGKGRLFAVECGLFSFGKSYKFTKHITRKKLVGQDVVDVEGKQLIFTASETISKKIDTDLRMAYEYKKMPMETLTERLTQLDSTLLTTERLTTKATFQIEMHIKKHKGQRHHSLYEVYKKRNKEVSDKYIELINAAQASGQDMFVAKAMMNPERKGCFTTVAGYQKEIADLNILIEEYILGAKKSDIDEGLNDVKARKNRFIEVKPLTVNPPSADLPKYGMLYAGDGNPEYVLNSENDLHDAINELARIFGNGAQNATYHLE